MGTELEKLLSDFRPIAGTASSRYGVEQEKGILSFNEDSQDQIRMLLVGQKVVKADNEHIVLSDGTVIKAIGHDGGCACSAGCYDLSVLNAVDNVITSVEFDYRPAGDDERPVFDQDDPDAPEDGWTGYYRIFVYADNQKINLMQFDGSDGNGYYGTGYGILVRMPR